MKTLVLTYILLLLGTLTYSQTNTIKVRKPDNQNIDIGKKLFKQNCSACHSETDAFITGPNLVGVTNRVPSKKWLILWIRSSSDLIKSGDAYANKIADQYATAQPDFKFLSDEEINNIITYIDTFVARPKK
ncbi:MAG: cytochrome c [Bacteroidetes bacterium]|nr:cytochrome c [Bacteroidota bacterium]